MDQNIPGADQGQRDDLPTTIVIGESYGGRAPNFTIENARFFGRPNFAGELDRFKDDRRKFTVIIPEEAVEPLRNLGYNVKERIPTEEEAAAGRERLFHLKVFMNFTPDPRPEDPDHEKGPDVWVKMGDRLEKLNSKTVQMFDRARMISMDLEVRGWEYDPEDASGQLSARLVQFVGTIQPNLFQQKYQGL